MFKCFWGSCPYFLEPLMFSFALQLLDFHFTVEIQKQILVILVPFNRMNV